MSNYQLGPTQQPVPTTWGQAHHYYATPVAATTLAEAPPYAGAAARFIAFWIDALIVTIPFGIVFGWDAITSMEIDGSIDDYLAIVAAWLYSALQESSSRMATVGQRAMNICVTDEHHQQITFLRATGRHLASWISGAILGIGYLMYFFTGKKQCLHDKIAETLVVSGRAA